MIRSAFSTVACPTWTLDRAALSAAEWGFMGVELRSFGEGGTEFACDPALTSGVKVRRLFREAGVALAGIATGVRFDAPIRPPIVGNLLSAREASVNEGKHMVAVAANVGAPYVRVFGFEGPVGESKKSLFRRVCDRLGRVCDYARNRDVTILIENGGTFPTAVDLVDIIRRVSQPQLAASYDAATAWLVGEDPSAGVESLGRWLRVARVRDQRAGKVCRLGTGDVPLRAFLGAVQRADQAWGTDPWAVYTWDRAWLPELAAAEEVMPGAAKLLADWTGGGGVMHRPAAFQSAAPAMAV
ncbi:MAG: sugar phosphate isomerase/epimerase [Phycisphaerae bacterium]|nr:sugar phosphate isomerase/epimerase [Phycisphaerae bacterium]